MTGESFETSFAGLIVRGRDLPEILMGEAAEGLIAEVPADDFPTATAIRMQHWANVQFEGAISLLSDKQTSAAAEVLLRSLLEACTHLFFVATAPPDERACRAIRVEMGMAQEIINLGSKLRSADEDAVANMVAEGNSRRMILEAERNRIRCKGGPRSYGAVGATLKEMVRTDPALDWVPQLYVVASAVAHQLLPDRIMRDTGKGTNTVNEPPPSERAARLDHLLATYRLAGSAFFEIVRPAEEPKVFSGVVQGIRDEALLRHAMEGRFDESEL